MLAYAPAPGQFVQNPQFNDPARALGALRFAGVPRALVRRIDTSAALAVPGVVAVLTAADVPGRREQGLIAPDWPLLVAEGEIVR